MTHAEIILRIFLMLHTGYVAVLVLAIGVPYWRNREYRHVWSMSVSFALLTGLCVWLLWTSNRHWAEFAIALAAFVVGDFGLFHIHAKSQAMRKDGQKP